MPKRITFETQFVNFCQSQPVETVDTFLKMGSAILAGRKPKTEAKAGKKKAEPAPIPEAMPIVVESKAPRQV